MSIVDPPAATTAEEMFALPEDGTERELIEGRLREKSPTLRTRRHSRILLRLGFLLMQWRERQPETRGHAVVGEAWFRLRRDPETCVGIGIACVPAEVVARTPEGSAFFEGPPLLAAEIFPPRETYGEIGEKVLAYLQSGVALVWFVDPKFRTVTVYRPGAEPELFNALQEISAEPHLPGFRIPVARIFGP